MSTWYSIDNSYRSACGRHVTKLDQSDEERGFYSTLGRNNLFEMDMQKESHVPIAAGNPPATQRKTSLGDKVDIQKG
jgi:hypothetical protein